jgi:hypothetical protein
VGAFYEKSNSSSGYSIYLIDYTNYSRKPSFISYSNVFRHIFSTPSEELPDTHPVYVSFNRQNYTAELEYSNLWMR